MSVCDCVLKRMRERKRVDLFSMSINIPNTLVKHKALKCFKYEHPFNSIYLKILLSMKSDSFGLDFTILDINVCVCVCVCVVCLCSHSLTLIVAISPQVI